MENTSEMEGVLISGYAKLPTNITSQEIYKTLVMVVIVDLQSGLISKAECSVVTEIAKQYVEKLVIGYNMNNGIGALIERFEILYHGQTKKAVETSLKMIFAKYSEIISGIKSND